MERWLEVVVLEDTTRERYDDLNRLCVLPTFGSMPASRIDAELPACTAAARSAATAGLAAGTSAIR